MHRPLAAACSVVLASTSIAGDLDPPAGPVSETLKTLVEVEPRTIINAENTPGDADSVFKITQSGSYYLAGNISVLLAEAAIEIAADDVSIDLNGFQIRAIGLATLQGVRSSVSPIRNVHIRNGAIHGFGENGVEILACQNLRIENVRVTDCGDNGMLITGDSSVITGCSARNNALAGIRVTAEGVVSRCTAAYNGSDGIAATNGSTVTECAAFQNTGAGISVGTSCVASRCSSLFNDQDGFRASSGAIIESCVAGGNGQHGIDAAGLCVVRGNDCQANGSAGITASASVNRIEGNHCAFNVVGIDVDGISNVIVGNTCSNNPTNYDIDPDNRYGPILDISAAGTPGVTGSAAAGTMTSADPWANFSH